MSRTSTRAVRLPLLAVLALVACALFANAGVRLVPATMAASTDTVSVSASVGSSLSVSDACSSTYSIAVGLGAYSADDCAFDFGSSNDSTTTLRITSSAGAFLSGGFTDHVGGCGALVNDTVGIKYTSGDAGVSSGLGCPVSAMATNGDFVAIPDTPTAACATTNLALDNTCTLAVGIKETGSNTLPGTYTGTLDVDVIG